MVFSSSIFLLAFMPLFFIVYFALPWRLAKNVWLLIASLFFYAWGEPVYVLLMISSIVVNWAFGLVFGAGAEGGDGARASQHAKHANADADGRQPAKRNGGRIALLVLAVAFNVAVIGFFKYEGFIAANVNALMGHELIPDLQLPLPIGISFYTLQALSYVIDVYRGEVRPQRNILFLGMYVACFPQLIAGPIVRYQTIQDQVVNRKENLKDCASGLRLFIVGLGKKVLLANTVAVLANDMLAAGGASIGLVGAWGGLIAYTFQIYFDFSGYSDMAIGLGRMMGFKYLRNFNYPYISKSITEFWRRWHISLSSFFRDYIYIPLGGSRCSKGRHIFNIAVVWAITGLWHGAAWNYVLWGVYYGVLLICEKYLWGRALGKAPALVGHVYTIVVFVFGWSFFWITDPSQLVPYWKALVGMFGLTGEQSFWQLTVWEYWPMFVICALASTPIVPYLKERFVTWAQAREEFSFARDSLVNPRHIQADDVCTFEVAPKDGASGTAYCILGVVLDVCLLAMLVLSAFSVVSGSFNPFIYFQF